MAQQHALFHSSVCLDIVLRQKHILKVRLEKWFISCLFVMLNRAALDHWKWIFVMYRIMILQYVVKCDFQYMIDTQSTILTHTMCSCHLKSKNLTKSAV